VAGFFGNYGSISIVQNHIHTTADGKRLLVMHGHELDTVIQNVKWLAFVGDMGYQFLLKLNRPINALRRLFGLDYWSLSSYVKMRVKDAVSFIGRFEEEIVRYSKEYHVDGVVCGHIHAPAIRAIEGTGYYNSGDWVESASALLEDHTGRIELITKFVDPEKAPKPAPVAENAELSPLPGSGIKEVPL